MNKSFEIGQSNELIKDGSIYDLHNLYDLIGIVLKTKDRRLQLLFEPNPEYGKGQRPVSLSFEGIDYLEFSPNFGAQFISGLDEVGYKSPRDHDDEWLMNEQHTTSDDHLFFRMDGGDFVRLHCRHADLIEGTRLD
jgi:hypothetical protein